MGDSASRYAEYAELRYSLPPVDCSHAVSSCILRLLSSLREEEVVLQVLLGQFNLHIALPNVSSKGVCDLLSILLLTDATSSH